MRIRSIRPEFWSSEDVSEMDWHTRLVYIGLWSYVDDNGVGRDKVQLITAALFALDDETIPGGLPECSRRVTEALRHLSSGGQITRYRVSNKPYLHVTAWNTHQRIEKASKGRYPLPTCDDAEFRESSPTTPGTLPDMSTPGEGEKGRRGEGEKGIPAEPDDAPASVAIGRALAIVDTDSPTAQTLTAEWIDHCEKQPPKSVVGQVAKHLKAMLDEGIEPERIRAALAEWNRKGLHPSTLPSVVHEIGNRRPATRKNDIDWDVALERARQIDANGGIA